MFKNKLLSSLVFAALSLLILCPITANASTWSAYIDPGGFEIGGFTIYLNVSQDFAFIGGTPSAPYGNAVPIAWADEAVNLGNAADSPRYAKFGSSDFNFLFFGNPPDPLTTGTLFSFDYTGTINSLSLVQFPDYSNPTRDLYTTGDMVLSSFDGSGAVFNAVSIPSTIMLLGGGLIGLVALRRRRA